MADNKGKGGATEASETNGADEEHEPSVDTEASEGEKHDNGFAQHEAHEAAHDHGHGAPARGAHGVSAHGAHGASAHGASAHGAHGASAHRAHGAHGHKPNIREYLIIFAVLAALTVLEVAVAKVPGLSRKLVGIALIGLALTKAGIVGLYYMHLKHETKVLKLTVALPMAAPTIYALVLISEAAWRLTR